MGGGGALSILCRQKYIDFFLTYQPVYESVIRKPDPNLQGSFRQLIPGGRGMHLAWILAQDRGRMGSHTKTSAPAPG